MNQKGGLPICVNQHVQVTPAHGEEEWYASVVQDLNGEEFCIAVPTRGTQPLVLSQGDWVKVTFNTDVSRFEFETFMKGLRSDNIPLCVLAMPKEYKRTQLREFVRIFTVLEVHCSELPEEGQKAAFIKGSSLDLSGGGIKLLLKKKYEEGTRLLVKFSLPLKTGPEQMIVPGRVVRTWPDENTGFYKVAVRFQDISRRQQDLVIRYILIKMSEQRWLR